MFVLNNFSAVRDNKTILDSISFELKTGSISVLLGKNGAGKSSLALSLMCHPAYKTTGSAYLFGSNLLELAIHERSKSGFFLSFQTPFEIPGVKTLTFLYEMCRAHGQLYDSIEQFQQQVKKYIQLLQLNESFLYRELNVGFSGGEKKRFELLQVFLLKPKFLILDEPDSGLDIEALEILIKALKILKEEHPNIIILIITHYKKLLESMAPDNVFVMEQGKITNSGNYSVAERIFERGYDDK